MKLCSCEHNVPGQTFTERARYLADHGVEGVELTIADKGLLLGSMRHRVDEVTRACKETGVAPTLITTKIFDLLDVDPARRAGAEAELRDHMESTVKNAFTRSEA